MKLFVDDIRPAPKGWHLARTVTEAIRCLDTMVFEEVSLDHDISHAVMMDNGGIVSRPYPCGETFEPVARFMVAARKSMGLINVEKVTVHTANPTGAQKLMRILEREYRIVLKMSAACNRLEIQDK